MINGNIVLLAEYLEKNLGVTASEGAMFAEEILKQFGQSDSLLDRLQAAESRLAEWETLRTNDVATHQNILRGIIALTRPQALHLAGAQDYDELKDRLQAVEKERDRFRDQRNIAEGVAGQNDLELRQIKSERDRYKTALEFYADPNTYFALVIFPDPPCGEFVDDFSDVPDWGTRPGKRAREALQPAQKDAPEKGTK